MSGSAFRVPLRGELLFGFAWWWVHFLWAPKENEPKERRPSAGPARLRRSGCPVLLAASGAHANSRLWRSDMDGLLPLAAAALGGAETGVQERESAPVRRLWWFRLGCGGFMGGAWVWRSHCFARDRRLGAAPRRSFRHFPSR